jgi:radical SAM protein with 4Fe4S-binding SPASM domain
MSVWGCFPLSQLPVKSLYDFDSIGDVHRFFREFQIKLRVESGGIFDECDECRHRESGLCSGGCVAHVAAKLKEEPRIRFEEFYQ